VEIIHRSVGQSLSQTSLDVYGRFPIDLRTGTYPKGYKGVYTLKITKIGL